MIFVAVLLLGIALSVFVYLHGRAVQLVSEPLLRQQLPALQLISSLQLSVAAQEPILYEYYASIERDNFRKRYALNEKAIQRDIAGLYSKQVDPERLHLIREYCDQMNKLGADLDNTLKVYGEERVDWDHAREILVEVSAAGRRVNAELETLAVSIREQVSVAGTKTRKYFKAVITAVFAFSIILGVLAALVAYMVSAYLSGEAERHRLAKFVEKNPGPVLSISSSGLVTYANPSAKQMRSELDLDDVPLEHMLPPDLNERLLTLRKSDSPSQRFEYEVGNRVLDCSVVFLREHGMFHCYISDVTDRKSAETNLREQALHDSVTGLPNRRYLAEQVATLGMSDRYVLMLINFDRFHKFLGNVGPEMVDETLRQVAGRLSAVFPPLGSRPQLYRYEGDSFVLLVPINRQEDDGARLAQHVLSVLREAFEVGGRKMFLSASIGISMHPRDGRRAPELVHNAGTALHSVKLSGGGNWRIYDSHMSSYAKERMSTEADLRNAVQKQQLFLEFQPQVDLASGQVLAGEALVRWNRTGYGLVAPEAFIPVAEETGLINAIGDWVLVQSCHAAVRWQTLLSGVVGVAVNISAHQLQAPGLVKRVRDVLQETGLNPAFLELEITEGSAMEDVERTVHILDQLKSLGVRLAIDDFGTGFSSMNYLSRFPIDRLKIDQSFIKGLGLDDTATEITAAVISLGQKLRLKVIAEGVETQLQFEKLHELGCDEMQGFLFSKPVSETDFVSLVQQPAAALKSAGMAMFEQRPGLSSAV